MVLNKHLINGRIFYKIIIVVVVVIIIIHKRTKDTKREIKDYKHKPRASVVAQMVKNLPAM